MGRLPLPISDYITDTKTALDNSLRLLQAMCDLAADAGWLATALAVMALVQSLVQARPAPPVCPASTWIHAARLMPQRCPLQGCWWDDSGLLTLPGVTAEAAAALQAQGLRGLRELVDLAAGDARRAHDLLQRALGSAERAQAALQARMRCAAGCGQVSPAGRRTHVVAVHRSASGCQP